jgi:hypothetical protein
MSQPLQAVGEPVQKGARSRNACMLQHAVAIGDGPMVGLSGQSLENAGNLQSSLGGA